MADVIKTDYMGQPSLGYSEYWFKDDAARNAVSPLPGDRAIMQNKDCYFCWDKGTWTKMGA